MDEAEAILILEREMSRYRKRSYEELLSLVGRAESFWRSAPSGAKYQVEMQVFFDDEKAKSSLRVAGSVDDGGWRALAPLCSDFIVAPDGSFVGE